MKMGSECNSELRCIELTPHDLEIMGLNPAGRYRRIFTFLSSEWNVLKRVFDEDAILKILI